MKTRTIAIAENHDLLRYALRELLTFLGFKVLAEAANGGVLIHKLTFTGQLPDICIVNISLSVANGIETIKDIKAKWPHIKILALSFNKTEDEINLILASGADAFLHKGGDGNQLKRVLESL